MKKKLYLKPFVIPTIYSLFVVGLLVSIFITAQSKPADDENTYVSGTILDEQVPVVNTVTSEVTVGTPFKQDGVTIGKNYYNYQDTEDEQKSSIIYYEGIYLQNTGVDYVSTEVFDVMSILDGEVTDVNQEELLGKSVTIRHNNDTISVYQSLGEVLVKKGDQVVQGQIIGKSGTSSISSELGNHLHFELSLNGQFVDPEDYYGKKISELN